MEFCLSARKQISSRRGSQPTFSIPTPWEGKIFRETVLGTISDLGYTVLAILVIIVVATLHSEKSGTWGTQYQPICWKLYWQQYSEPSRTTQYWPICALTLKLEYRGKILFTVDWVCIYIYILELVHIFYDRGGVLSPFLHPTQ